MRNLTSDITRSMFANCNSAAYRHQRKSGSLSLAFPPINLELEIITQRHKQLIGAICSSSPLALFSKLLSYTSYAPITN